MPRTNTGRTSDSEANLSDRIAYERKRRELGVDALAKLLTEAGCKIAGSAILRIEKGTPRRRVTVDELIAFSTVFGVPPMDLLRPVALVRQDRADELATRLSEVGPAFDYAVELAVVTVQEYAQLAVEQPELEEYILNHMDTLLKRQQPRESTPFPVLFRLGEQHVTRDEAWAVYVQIHEAWENLQRLAVKSTGLGFDLGSSLLRAEED